MNTKMRSERTDFWKCGYILPSGRHCCAINAHPEDYCHYCEQQPPIELLPPVTNVEVLVAWLQASDERRREIEIASRPKVGQGGRYVRYYLGGFYGTIERELLTYGDDETWADSTDGLWEPLT